MNIIIRPLGRGRYAALLGDRLLCESRTPFFDTARVLLEDGVPGDTLITMTHQGSSIVSMSSTVGKAARLAILENDHGEPSIVPYRVSPPEMAFAATPGQQGLAFSRNGEVGSLIAHRPSQNSTSETYAR